jgi:hypothetical protein
MASELVEAMQTSPIDELDTLVDAIDALENEPSADVGLAAAKLARRYVENIDELSENETALLGAAISRSAAGNHDEACSPALAALTSLWRRVRERR